MGEPDGAPRGVTRLCVNVSSCHGWAWRSAAWGDQALCQCQQLPWVSLTERRVGWPGFVSMSAVAMGEPDGAPRGVTRLCVNVSSCHGWAWRSAAWGDQALCQCQQLPWVSLTERRVGWPGFVSMSAVAMGEPDGAPRRVTRLCVNVSSCHGWAWRSAAWGDQALCQCQQLPWVSLTERRVGWPGFVPMSAVAMCEPDGAPRGVTRLCANVSSCHGWAWRSAAWGDQALCQCQQLPWVSLTECRVGWPGFVPMSAVAMGEPDGAPRGVTRLCANVSSCHGWAWRSATWGDQALCQCQQRWCFSSLIRTA